MLLFCHVTFAHAKEVSCLKPQSNIYLQNLVVTKKLRSRGTGTLLLNAAKEYGKEKKADFFRTQVFPQNKDGMRFYERAKNPALFPATKIFLPSILFFPPKV